jgi:hypothetical protein
MAKFKSYLLVFLLIFIPLYPKFPLLDVSGSFVSIRLEDIVVALIVGFYGIELIINRFKSLSRPIPRSILLYLFIGVVATFSGIFLTKTATLNLGILHTLRRFEYMALFFVAYDWLTNKEQLKFLIRTLLLVSFVVAIYGLGQQLIQLPVISTSNSEFSKGLALTLGIDARINSTFAGHYDFAAFMVLPLLLILALLPVLKNKFVLIIMGLLIYSTMLLSASRIAFASLFISAVVLVILIRKKAWIWPLLLISGLGFFLSPQLRGRYLELVTTHFKISLVSVAHAQGETAPVSKAVDTVPDSLKPTAVPEDRSFSIRLNAEWPAALRAFTKNPILGSGFSSIGLAADNEYLRILAETGALGLLAFSLIHLRFFKSGLPFILKKYNPTVESAFIVAASCALISLLIGAVFIDYFEASKIAMIFWIIIGLAEKTKTFSPTHD